MTDKPARTGAEILAELNPTVRTGVAHICMRPDLIDRWNDANEKLMASKAQDAGNKRLGSGVSAETKRNAQQVRDIEDQIAAADVGFIFEKIGKTRHSEICEENPPRDGNVLDYSVGYNRDAVDDAVVHEALVDPVFYDCPAALPGYRGKPCDHTACGSWQALVKLLGPGEWEEMASVVREVNEAVSSAPKSLLASRILDKPAAGSARRARGA